MKRRNICFIGRDIRGEWVIVGRNGVKRYAECTRRQAAEEYTAECETVLKNGKKGGEKQ